MTLRAAGGGLSSIRLLSASAVPASVTGTLTETALATVSIPAGAMGLNGSVLIRTSWTYTNSANTKTLRIRFGGISGTSYMSVGFTTTATFCDQRGIRNRNSASSQVGSVTIGSTAFGSSAAVLPTSSVDTGASVDLVITGTNTNTGETITLESYEVWVTN